MAKVQIKEVMRKNVDCVLNMDTEEILLEVEGFDKPLLFKDLFSKFNGEAVGISVNLRINHTPDEE